MKGPILGAIVAGIAAIYWRDGLKQIRRGTRDAACSTLRSWSQALREPETGDALLPQLSN